MNTARTIALAILMGLTGCATVSTLPPPPPPGASGFLYVRVVSGPDTVSYAAIVYVEDQKPATVLKVVGPINHWPEFFGMLRATYGLQGPGEAYCNNPKPDPNFGPCPRFDPPARSQSLPPHPPPPISGYAISYSTQSGTVDPNTIGQPAADAAAAAVGDLGK